MVSAIERFHCTRSDAASHVSRPTHLHSLGQPPLTGSPQRPLSEGEAAEGGGAGQQLCPPELDLDLLQSPAVGEGTGVPVDLLVVGGSGRVEWDGVVRPSSWGGGHGTPQLTTASGDNGLGTPPLHQPRGDL